MIGRDTYIIGQTGHMIGRLNQMIDSSCYIVGPHFKEVKRFQNHIKKEETNVSSSDYHFSTSL